MGLGFQMGVGLGFRLGAGLGLGCRLGVGLGFRGLNLDVFTHLGIRVSRNLLSLRTTTLQKCAVVPWRARI